MPDEPIALDYITLNQMLVKNKDGTMKKFYSDLSAKPINNPDAKTWVDSKTGEAVEIKTYGTSIEKSSFTNAYSFKIDFIKISFTGAYEQVSVQKELTTLEFAKIMAYNEMLKNDDTTKQYMPETVLDFKALATKLNLDFATYFKPFMDQYGLPEKIVRSDHVSKDALKNAAQEILNTINESSNFTALKTLYASCYPVGSTKSDVLAYLNIPEKKYIAMK